MLKFIVSWALSVPVYLLIFKGLEGYGIPEWYFHILLSILVLLCYDASRAISKGETIE